MARRKTYDELAEENEEQREALNDIVDRLIDLGLIEDDEEESD